MKAFVLAFSVCCLVIFGCLTFLNKVVAQPLKTTYHFGSIELLEEQEVGRLVLQKMFQQLDITTEITPLPAERAQYMAVNALNDGEIMRIWSYGIENPATIRVPTPYYYLETMPFVKADSGIKITSLDDLSNYRIARVRGVKHTNNITEGLTNVFDVNNTESMFKLLEQGMVDIVITNTLDGNIKLKALGLVDKIIPMTKPLKTEPLYIYLSKENKLLGAVLDKEIQRLSKNGLLKKWVNQAEQSLMNVSKAK